MKKTNYYTETFAVDDSYRIDIVNDGEAYEAWISQKGYGVKYLMFGISIDDISHEMFLKVVKANTENYIKLYRAKIED